MTPSKLVWVVYWLLVLAGGLGAVAVYLAQAPTNPEGVTALACVAVWLGCSAVASTAAYGIARDLRGKQ